MLPEYVLLSRNIRCGLTEEEHYGLIIISDKKNKTVKKIGNDNGYNFCLRSCMKPLQFAAVQEIIDEFNLTEQEIAVACASHVGEKEHCDAVLSILKKCGIDEKYLLCPPQEPLSLRARKELIKGNHQCLPIHNNCSGKHAAILAYCRLKGFSPEEYNSVNHPAQKIILNFVAEKCEISLRQCKINRDGCTLPVLAMPFENLAKGFTNVFTDKNFHKIQSAIKNNPYYFGGKNRLDSEIVAASEGKLTAKVGAGNICCITDTDSGKNYIIKLIDGDNHARALIATELLNRENYFSKKEYSRLKKIFSPSIKDENGKILGKTAFCF